PRTQIVSVGYSNRVSTIDGATGGVIGGNGNDASVVMQDAGSNWTHALVPGFFGDGGSFVVYGDQSFGTGIELDGDGGGTDDPMLFMVGAGSGQTAIINLGFTGNGSVSLPVSAISSPEILDEPGVAGISASYIPAGGAIQTITSRTITCPAAGYVLAVASSEWDVGTTGGHVAGTLDWMIVGLSTSPATIPVDQDLDLSFSGALPTSASGYLEQSASVEIFPVAAGPVTIYYNCDPVAGELGGFFEVNLELLYVPTFYGTVSAVASAGNTSKPDQPNQDASGVTSAAIDLEKEKAESIAANNARIEKELADVKAELEAIKRQLKPGQLGGTPGGDQ
ncbi:MAG: DUF4349 domain-containing protein, partial [candidate division Zixibacteria bacterium]|nr:DUF4349 domain-containing protein [candidate division Zixibacteria bacterium]